MEVWLGVAAVGFSSSRVISRRLYDWFKCSRLLACNSYADSYAES